MTKDRILKADSIENIVKDFNESETREEAKHNLLRVQVYAPIKVYYACMQDYVSRFPKNPPPLDYQI